MSPDPTTIQGIINSSSQQAHFTSSCHSLSRARARTHTDGHTKTQTTSSEIFNRASQLALLLPSFITLHLLVCLCLFSQLICCLCCLSFLPFLLFICSLISAQPSSARDQLCADYFTFLLPFPAASCGPSLLLSTVCWFSVPILLSHCGPISLLPHLPCLQFHFSFFRSMFIPPTTTSGSAFVRRESIILLHPPTFCPLSPSLPEAASISPSLSPLHMPWPYIH